MPELPEVETIRGQIETNLFGFTVTKVHCFHSQIVSGDIEALVGETLLTVRRFGKLLVLDLSQQNTHTKISCAAHLKMTGRLELTFTQSDTPPLKDEHVRIFWNRGKERASLKFFDTRKFGHIQVIPTTEVEQLKFVHSLGPDALSITLKQFQDVCRISSRPIKSLLLDQHSIAGIGNIYACESLWMAKINPLVRANQLTHRQCLLLHTSVRRVLRESLRFGGASDNTYRDLWGHKGEYQNHFKVYHRKSLACSRCGTKITYTKLSGRGTFYCPNCQRKP